MHDRLPDEVLLLILDAISTPAHTQHAYKVRQQTLSGLARVARRYHQLAQPLLWQEVRAFRPAQLARIRQIEAERSSAAVTKLFHISTKGLDTREGGPVSPEEGVEASRVLRGVEDIRIDCVRSPLDLTLLGVHSGLRRLSLVNVDLGVCSPVHLPQLEQLQLERTIIPSPLLTEWLDPAYLSRLKAVRLVALYSALYAGAPSLDFSPAFLAQVDFVQTPGLSVEAMQRYHDSVGPPFLFGSSLTSNFARHLILAPHQFDGVARATTTLRKTESQVAAARIMEGEHPRVLLLPRTLKSLASTESRVADTLASFTAMSSARGVRLIWYGEDRAAEDDDLVSHEFWRYARELKAARAGET